MTATNMINSKYIPLCGCISRAITNYLVDDSHIEHRKGIPIDFLVV